MGAKTLLKEKGKIVLKTLLGQILLLTSLFLLLWLSQVGYGVIDQTVFPKPMAVSQSKNMADKERGKILIDSITFQMRRELDSIFGWSANDILFNRFIMDNRASRQYGVYHATKVLIEQYSMYIAKLGSNDRESEYLYNARIHNFAISPRALFFPSAEGEYQKGLKRIEKYKKSLDDGKGTYNLRTDDIYSTLNLIAGENMLGHALGLLQKSQDMPFYKLDNRIYEVQGIVLVVRDFLHTLDVLYPEIRQKNNDENIDAAMEYLDSIATYDPLYITKSFNSGELIIARLLYAKNRIEDIRDSIKM